MMYTDVMKKGIDVREAIFILEVAGQQYWTTYQANLDAKWDEVELPYTEEYVKKACSAYGDAKIQLEQFVEAIYTIESLKADMYRYAALAEKFNDEFYAEQASILEPFVQCIYDQMHLLPLVELALEKDKLAR